MGHLPTDELVEAAERGASSRALAHLAACEDCRRRAADLRATLAAVQSVDVPEPSPVFWSSFAARVSDTTASSEPLRVRWWFLERSSLRLKWSLAAAVLILAAGASLVWRPFARADRAASVVAGESVVAPAPTFPEPGAPDDESPWALVADASDGMDWELVSAAGLGPSPGSAERAVSQLSELERRELVKLLKAELAGSSL
jgi:hypothetical protein